MNGNMQTFHFSFSPVQSFVSQARKTRDLWAGSYILSYLAGKAMQAIRSNGGEIIFPYIKKDPLMELIEAEGKTDDPGIAAFVGSLPNRFTARVPDGFNGKTCEDAINTAWRKIALAVKDSVDRNGAIDETMWRRQIDHFWEFQWVLGEGSHLLDQRKNLRDHFPAPEPGEKCSLCGERQELSGNLKPIPSRIKEWWGKNIEGETISDLDDKDRLCAVCLTKRMFPVVSKAAIGWKIPKYYPSTSYMSAVDWLSGLIKHARTDEQTREKIDNYNQIVGDTVLDGVTEYQTQIDSLEKASEGKKPFNDLINLDGNLFYTSAITDKSLLFKNEGNPKAVQDGLKAIQNEFAKADQKKKEASPFFAILLMDGDGMGKLIGGEKSPGGRTAISQALADFTQQVPEIIKNHDGRLIYAGGDDVFALLPVNTVLACAQCCRKTYISEFCKTASFVPPLLATISAAVQYAHMKTALGPLVRDAHHLLDNVAKDGIGRDAIACRVWKRGGPILTWAQPWEKVVTPTGNILEDVTFAFQHESNRADKFSSKFFHKLRDQFTFINDVPDIDENTARDLLTVEYLANRDHVWDKNLSQTEITAKASERVRLIMRLCRKTSRHLEETQEGKYRVTFKSEDFYSADGALLVRFLSQKEV